jgi:hypothetical protein
MPVAVLDSQSANHRRQPNHAASPCNVTAPTPNAHTRQAYGASPAAEGQAFQAGPPSTPPMRFGAFRREQRRDRTVPGCLADTFRSQGFSPSQRFDPTVASWLFFKPLPSIGFLAFRAFPARPADSPLGTSCSLAVGPRRCRVLLPPFAASNRSKRQSKSRQIALGAGSRHRAHPDSAEAHAEMKHRQSSSPDFRALVQPSVRHSAPRCSRHAEPLLSWPSLPSEVYQRVRLAFASPHALQPDHLDTRAMTKSHGNDTRRPYGLCLRVSIRSTLGRHSKGVATTSLRFSTSYEPSRRIHRGRQATALRTSTKRRARMSFCAYLSTHIELSE